MNQELQCVVLSLEYSWETRIGRLYMPADQCCDMTGAIQCFHRLDPDVREIQTYQDGDPDTLYVFLGAGDSSKPENWQAFHPSYGLSHINKWMEAIERNKVIAIKKSKEQAARNEALFREYSEARAGGVPHKMSKWLF